MKNQLFSSSKFGLTQNFVKQNSHKDNIQLDELVDIDQDLGNLTHEYYSKQINLRIIYS